MYMHTSLISLSLMKKAKALRIFMIVKYAVKCNYEV